MFTAIILVCSMEHMMSTDNCMAITSTAFFPTRAECEINVRDTVISGDLAMQFPGTKPIDFYCINWSDLKA